MSKRIKYKSIKEDETIDISVAFSQASALLDQAAKKAIYENDAELLLSVADRWITIGKLFASAEEEVEEVDGNSKGIYGFGAHQEGDENERPTADYEDRCKTIS